MLANAHKALLNNSHGLGFIRVVADSNRGQARIRAKSVGNPKP